jgi:hypothetical protein
MLAPDLKKKRRKKMRLIDADKLLERETAAYSAAMMHGSGRELFSVIHSTVKDILESAPTVDAVEVVRCGECWAYNQPDCPMSGSPGRVSVSDFCSYGERRTDD